MEEWNRCVARNCTLPSSERLSWLIPLSLLIDFLQLRILTFLTWNLLWNLDLIFALLLTPDLKNQQQDFRAQGKVEHKQVISLCASEVRANKAFT